MKDEEAREVPRWAEVLEEEIWRRINELLDAGWRTMDIVRELGIPKEKVRSLQIYVQKHGPRRRLVQFARFKDALLSQIEEFGDDLAQSLSVIAALAVSNKTKSTTQVRALEAMTEFAKVLRRIMQDDVKEVRETDVRVEVTDKRKALSSKAIDAIKDIYGLGADHDDEHDAA